MVRVCTWLLKYDDRLIATYSTTSAALNRRDYISRCRLHSNCRSCYHPMLHESTAEPMRTEMFRWVSAFLKCRRKQSRQDDNKHWRGNTRGVYTIRLYEPAAIFYRFISPQPLVWYRIVSVQQFSSIRSPLMRTILTRRVYLARSTCLLLYVLCQATCMLPTFTYPIRPKQHCCVSVAYEGNVNISWRTNLFRRSAWNIVLAASWYLLLATHRTVCIQTMLE